jgi:hypothetical protein
MLFGTRLRLAVKDEHDSAQSYDLIAEREKAWIRMFCCQKKLVMPLEKSSLQMHYLAQNTTMKRKRNRNEPYHS